MRSSPLSSIQTMSTDAGRLSEALLARAKVVARQITQRVRSLLEPTEDTYQQSQDRDPYRPLRVLCVDDCEDAADSLAAVLELLGCETRACYDGATALSIAHEFHPEACFLDLCMPGMDGLELAARLRAGANYHPRILVAATALGSLEDRTQTAVTGFHYHLIKPIDTTTLRAAVDSFRALLRRPRNEPDSKRPAD